jgi:hypothetical protein
LTCLKNLDTRHDTPRGKKLYKKRAATIEPVFAQIKQPHDPHRVSLRPPRCRQRMETDLRHAQPAQDVAPRLTGDGHTITGTADTSDSPPWPRRSHAPIRGPCDSLAASIFFATELDGRPKK